MVTVVARCVQTTLFFAAFIVACEAAYVLDSKDPDYNCGNGESLSLNPGAAKYCCSANNVEKWDYTVTGGGTANNDIIEYHIENYAKTYLFDNSKCYVSYSWWTGKSCTGWSCSASSGSNSNNCVDSYTYNTMSNAITGSSTGSATPLCLKISCKNLFETCDATAVTANFYVSTSSAVTTCDASTAPTNGGVGTCTSALASGSTCQPTCNSGYTVSGVSSCSAATSSNTSTLSAATCVATSSGDCKCTCCSGNFCLPSVAGLFNAGSSSACNAAACRTRYSGSCPASGSSGSVSATYTASSAPSTPLVYSETGTLPGGQGGVTEAITGMSCAKYKVTLTSASSVVIVGAYTQAQTDTILYKYNYNQYQSMSAAVVDIKARAVATSLCDFADFTDSVCEKVVLLNSATTYRLGALNSGSTAVTGTFEVSTCTAAELGAAQSGSSAIISGSTSIDALLPIAVGIAGLVLAY